MASKFWANESGGSGSDSDSDSDSDSSIGGAGKGTGPSRWQVDSDSESEEEVRGGIFVFSTLAPFHWVLHTLRRLLPIWRGVIRLFDSPVGVALNHSPIIWWGDISKGLQSLTSNDPLKHGNWTPPA